MEATGLRPVLTSFLNLPKSGVKPWTFWFSLHCLRTLRYRSPGPKGFFSLQDSAIPRSRGAPNWSHLRRRWGLQSRRSLKFQFLFFIMKIFSSVFSFFSINNNNNNNNNVHPDEPFINDDNNNNKLTHRMNFFSAATNNKKSFFFRRRNFVFYLSLNTLAKNNNNSDTYFNF